MCNSVTIIIKCIVNVEYSSSGIAEHCVNTLFYKTFKNNLWWVAGQFVMQIVVLMGWLPILGL